MGYTNYYLRFESREEFAALEVGTTIGMAVAEIGLVESSPAEVDEAGNVLTPAVIADGWHVNVRCGGELPAELQPFVIAPATPEADWL